MIFRIAFRSIFRNARRSFTTALTIGVGAAAMLTFAAYALYDVYVLQTAAVERGGHLTVYRRGFFDFGSGDPAIWGVGDYPRIVRLFRSDPVLARMTAVVTPIQGLGGIAVNPESGGSQTYFATGFVPADQMWMQHWNEYGVGENLENTDLRTDDPSQGVIGFGFARNLGLCERLLLPDCPRPPKDAPTRDAGVAGVATQDFSGLTGPAASNAGAPRIDLLAATAGGAPNVVSLRIARVEKQGSKEMDDAYVALNLRLAQQLVYGRGEAKVTGIVLQLHRTEDIGSARARLMALFAADHLALEVRDYREINGYLGQTLGFFRSMFAFIALLIAVVVLFSVSNTMGMSVMERIAEIGATRALGARRARIHHQFVLEGALLGVLGASAGVAVAFAVTAAVNGAGLTWTPPGDAHPIPLKLYLLGAPQVIVAVWMALVLIATLAALVLAHRAARLAIVDALRHSKPTALLIGLAVIAVAVPVQAQTAREIVAGADKVRNPDKPFQVTATLIDYRAGRPIGRDVYSVYSKLDPATGQFRDLMLYVSPPRDAGKVLLLNGPNLWFYDPASRESIRISPQQKLSGQASAGDVLTENLAVDYAPRLVGSETIQDGERQVRDCWRLDLKAAGSGATYNHVDYWIEKGSYAPIKARLYADSGALMKTLFYRHFVARDGRKPPTQAVIIDAVDQTLVTTVDFGEARLQDLPDAWFNRDYLPHLHLK